MNLRDIHARAFTQARRGFARYNASLSQRFGGSQFHFKPFLEAILVAPDAAHLSTGITWNQLGLLSTQVKPTAQVKIEIEKIGRNFPVP
jgi:hypothetical protein